MLVTCHKTSLLARCQERGYKLVDVMPCVVKQDGDTWTIDTEHEKYPRPRPSANAEMRAEAIKRQREAIANQANATPPPTASPPPTSGPGTELKKMLAKIGIKASSTCSCTTRARIMDEKGVQWCRDNVDTIVSWLREEATKRGLPFVDMAGKLLVKRSISLAEKAEKKKAQEAAAAQSNG